MKTRPVILIVLDGFGIPPKSIESLSPFKLASCPTIRNIEHFFPFTTLKASGISIGLPIGEPGNSEVGHLTIGAGRTLYHHLPRIIGAIKNKSFFKNEAILKAINHVSIDNKLHIIGLFSSGSVHSYSAHLYALIDLVCKEKTQTMLHLFSDGKDAPRREFLSKIKELKLYLDKKDCNNITIASVVGRFYAMDRDKNWKRIEKAYNCLIGKSGQSFVDIEDYIEDSYGAELNDEKIEPAYLINYMGYPIGNIKDGDSIIFFNFREDSMREITHTFVDKKFEHFERQKLSNINVSTMTAYDKDLNTEIAFEPLKVENSLAEIISKSKKTQLKIAETQKYAHITYFFNGGIEEAFAGEERIIIPSIDIENIKENPAMASGEITKILLNKFTDYDFTLINYANPDIVGHTGDFEATIKALESVDDALDKIIKKVLEKDAILLITGDHGNAEEKHYGLTGRIRTKHTTNVVPLFIIGNEYKLNEERTEDEIEKEYKRTRGVLTDIAPSIIELMGLKKPKEMTGISLISKLTST